METKPYYVAFTGHRPDKIGGYKLDNPMYLKIKTELVSQIDMHFQVHGKQLCLVTGGALGVDQMVARIALEMGIPYVICVPHQGHGSNWPLDAQELYEHLKANARTVKLVTDAPYSPQALQIRNQFMVDGSEELIAVYDGSTGGTANCIQYAQSVGKQITTIWPF